MFARVDKETTAAYVADHPELRTLLQNLNEQLRRYTLQLCYRVCDGIITFSAAAEANKLFTDKRGDNPLLDTAVLIRSCQSSTEPGTNSRLPLNTLLARCKDPETRGLGSSRP
jgi:hypothetical protein